MQPVPPMIRRRHDAPAPANAARSSCRADAAPTTRATRRRVLSILAGGGLAGLLALVRAGGGAGGARAAETGDMPVHRWRGRLLGAEASLALHHPDEKTARRAIAAVIDEVRRLERLFSLHDPDSLLVRLNEGEAVARLPEDFARMLAQAARFHRLGEGYFDPTVGPLWDLYAEHFTLRPRDPIGPGETAIEAARARIGLARLPRPRAGASWRLPVGMKLGFNGIAQGYVTDRAVALLRRFGFRHALVNFGEYRALGTHPDGRPFRLALADPRHPGRRIGDLPLAAGMALATSSPLAAVFDETGRFHHLLDPHSGRPAPEAPASLWVRAPDATSADALSTTLAVAPAELRGRILARVDGARAWFAGADGEVREIRRA